MEKNKNWTFCMNQNAFCIWKVCTKKTKQDMFPEHHAYGLINLQSQGKGHKVNNDAI